MTSADEQCRPKYPLRDWLRYECSAVRSCSDLSAAFAWSPILPSQDSACKAARVIVANISKDHEHIGALVRAVFKLKQGDQDYWRER